MKLITTNVVMVHHLNMEDGNEMLRNCIITSPNHILCGKKIMISTFTPKTNGKFGHAEISFFIEGTDKIYKSIKEFCVDNEFEFESE